MASKLSSSYTLCDSCGKQSATIGMCQNCNGNMCETCFNHHSTGLMFKAHKLIMFSGETEYTIKAKLDITDEKCPNHPFDNITYYCEDHNITFCGQCMFEGHKHCRETTNLVNTGASTNIDRFEGKSTRLKEDIARLESMIETSGNICDENKTKALSDLRIFRKELNSWFDSLQEHMECEIEKRCNETMEALKNVDKICSKAKQVLLEHVSQFEEYTKAALYGRKHLLAIKGLKVIEKESSEIRSARNRTKAVEFDFAPNEFLEISLMKNVKSFGSLVERIVGSDELHVST